MELLSAGVFTEELRSGESAILAVSTSTFATVGWLPRGKENEALLTTSLPDYFRKFGTYWKYSDTPHAVTAFYKNNGARAYLVRVTPSDAVLAQYTIETNKWLVQCISKGSWGNLIRLKLIGNQNYYDFNTSTYSRFDAQVQEETTDGAGDFSTVETFEALSLSDPDDPDYLSVAINDEENGSNEIRVTKINGGIPTVFNSSAVSGETVGTGTGLQQLFSHTMAQTPIAPQILITFFFGQIFVTH